jgi:hypothetical protein
MTGKINQDISKQLKYRLYPETLTPTFTIVEGSLPAGLSLNSNNGIISGNTGISFTGEIKIKVEC